MKFLHTDFLGGNDHTVMVTLDARANVMLLAGSDFDAYRRGDRFRYYGGWATKSPVYLRPPRHDHWHVVVDLGGYSGQVKAVIRIAKRCAA